MALEVAEQTAAKLVAVAERTAGELLLGADRDRSHGVGVGGGYGVSGADRDRSHGVGGGYGVSGADRGGSLDSMLRTGKGSTELNAIYNGEACKGHLGDELLSDSFPYNEIENGMLWEVDGKWVVQGAVSVDIGANPSAEGADEDEGVDEQAAKVVDIVDTFRLQEQPSFDKKQFVTYMKRYIKLLTPKLDAEKQELFKKHIEGATKSLLSKLGDLQFFVGESMHDDGSVVFAYYKEGATDPTFLYFAYGLKEVKC